MYIVYFIPKGEAASEWDDAFTFMSSIPDYSTAERIAQNLKDEGFVFDAWANKE